MSNLIISTPKPSFSLTNRPQTTSPSKKKRGKATFTNPDIITPSFLEESFGASIGSRVRSLGQFQDIGPPDLLHICKYDRSSKKEEGEYHFLTGIDISSEIAAIAYISTINLKYSHFNYQKHPTCYTYCSYNAFSKEDIRIKKEFPGSEYTLQTITNDKHRSTSEGVTEKTWSETFVSSIVRSVTIGLDDERKLPSLVEKPLFTSKNSTKNIIKQLVQFIDRGFLLGASENVSKPSIYENYLLDTLYTIVEISGLVDYTISEIRSLAFAKYDLSLIMIKILMINNREVEAVRLLHLAIKKNPRDHYLLNEQAKFLIRKGEINLAIDVSLRSTMIDPYGFECWYLLSKSYLYKKKYTLALLTINNAQIINQRSKDIIILNSKDKLNEPAPNSGKVKSVWDDLLHIYGPGAHNMMKYSNQAEIDAVDPMIARVNKFALKGSIKEVYELLVLFVDCIGWDGLLKTRAEVFVMDSEARISEASAVGTETEVSTEGSGIDFNNFLSKRICEPWLENLLGILFEDLRISMIFERQLNEQTKHSVLEWGLIGLTCARTHHYSNAVSCLRTTLNNKFDIISARSLMVLWGKQQYDMEFKAWQRTYNRSVKKSFEVPLDQLIDAIVLSISYNSRFYNESQVEILLFLKNFFSLIDVDYISNRVQVLLERDDVHDWNNSGCIPVFDGLVNTLKIFGEL